jgi:hypothetical protein
MPHELLSGRQRDTGSGEVRPEVEAMAMQVDLIAVAVVAVDLGEAAVGMEALDEVGGDLEDRVGVPRREVEARRPGRRGAAGYPPCRSS